MKSVRTLVGLLSLALLLALVSAPVTWAEDDDQEPAGAGLFLKEKPGQSTDAPNCTWTCSDGRTGSAEVLNLQQCLYACAGACGGPCIEA